MIAFLLTSLIAQGTTDEPLACATLLERDGLYYVEARIGKSQKKLDLMLDTGSNATIVWDAETVGGKDDLREETVHFGSGEIKTQVGMIAKLPEPLQALQRGRAKFAGMIGAPIFDGYTVGLDLKGKCLAFFPQAQFLKAARFWFSSTYIWDEKLPWRWARDGRVIGVAGGNSFAARQRYPTLLACEISSGIKTSISFEGTEVSAFLDTGSDSGNFRAEHFDDLNALKVLRTEEVKSVFGAHRMRIYSVPSISIAGIKVTKVETTVTDNFPNLVSNKVMAQFKWLFSKSEGAALVAPL